MPWAPPYCSAADLAHFISEASVGSDNTELTLAIESASRSVDRITGRQFGVVDEPESRWYVPTYDRDRRRWIIDVDDLMTADGLAVEFGDGATVSGPPLAGYVPLPVNAVANGIPWTQLVFGQGFSVASGNQARVTAKWGWTEIPPTIKLATLLQASRLFARRHAPFGVAGNPEVGQLRLLERLDADVAVSVRPFARVWGAV